MKIKKKIKKNATPKEPHRCAALPAKASLEGKRLRHNYHASLSFVPKLNPRENRSLDALNP